MRCAEQKPSVSQSLSCCPVLVQDAALEKARAGEGRDVEHVALFDDQTLQAQEAAKPARKRSRRGSKA